jgi:hypothetical protein
VWLSPAVTALLQREDGPGATGRIASRAPAGPAALDQLFAALDGAVLPQALARPDVVR